MPFHISWILSQSINQSAWNQISQLRILLTIYSLRREWLVLSHWQPGAIGRINLLLFFFWGLLFPVAYAQFPTQTSIRLTTTNGLPHNSVTGVEQDRAGFVWIATHDGLARYDGRSVKVFRHRQGDSTSLISNKISQFDRIDSRTFLVTTESGSFQRFDPVTETFTTVLDERFLARNKVPVTQGQLSADGRHLWGILPNTWLIDYELQHKTLKVYDVSKLVGSPNLHDFILTATGYIYGYCPRGLWQFDTKTGRSQFIPLPFKAPNQEQDGGFWPINRYKVVEAPNGQIAIFGHQIIVLFDPVRNQLRTVPIPDAIHNSTTAGRKLATVVSYALKTMADGRLYLGYMNRVYYLNENFQFKLLQPPGPTLGKVAPWLLDQSGVLWISGASAGLNRLDIHALPFAFSPRQKSFCEDLLEQDLGVSLPNQYEVWDNDHWPRYALSAERTGYLADPSHIYRHQPGRSTLTELTDLQLNQGTVCCKLCLKVTPRGRIWFYNGLRGLVEADPQGKGSRLYSNSQLPIRELKPGYDAADIQPLGQSVWVGSQIGLGLFRYDRLRQRYDRPLVYDEHSVNSLPSNYISCLSADPTDSTVLWIGTSGGGLCRLATRTMRFQRFGEAQGFPNNIIQSMETDDQGQLWCATNRGLVRVNPKTLTWRHFTTDDGLAENAFVFTSSAHLPDGRLVFGTPNGRVVFDPAAIRDRDYQPPMVLTSLLVNNKPLDVNGPSVGLPGSAESRNDLPAPLNSLSELVLDYTQNFLTLAFAGLHYGKAEKLHYRHQLVGVDEDWVTTGTQNTANYTQLAPGRYQFRVNSTTADGRWSQQIKQLRIVITPPFWATWWAYLVYVLAFGGLVLGVIRFRTRQIRQQQEIKLKQQEAEQLRAVDEVKTRFFSNITHEFRTPLTLILSPTEKLLREPKHDAFTTQLLSSIHHNAGKLLQLINQLLDLSKLEGNSMPIALVRGDAVALIERLVEPFYLIAASRDITLQINGLASTRFDGPWLFDADKWEKILTNLLANALKFTPAGGQVSLTLEQPDNKQLILHLADTGVGITAQHIPHIFDRFYQVDTSRTRAFEGTGIGLALVNELIQLLGGSISVHSRTEAPTGTTFTLTLPLRPATEEADAPALVLPDIDPTAWWATPSGLIPTDQQPIPRVTEDTPLVLVVEDNEELRSFIVGELATRYRILTAADGEEGWAICQQELPDLVVADVMMPRLDGFQLTHRIKSTMDTNHIGVIILTAKAAQESRIMGLEQGADDYLTKPFHVDELFLRVENMLTRQANLRAHLYRQLATPSVKNEEPVIDPFVRKLHQVIEARLDDSTFGVENLAQAMAMSRRTLHRKLTTTTNLSANDFIRHYRLQRATQLLKAGHLIAETAYSVGFESPSYFAMIFKQAFNQTPSEFVSNQGT